MVESFTARVLRACTDVREDTQSMAIDARAVPVGPPVQSDMVMLAGKDVRQLRNRSYTMQHVMAVHADGVDVFRLQAEFPAKWTLDCDRALIAGMARLGCSSLPILWATEPTLRPFEALFANARLPLARLKQIITINRGRKQRVVFHVDVTKVTMTYSQGPVPEPLASSVTEQVRLVPKVDPSRTPRMKVEAAEPKKKLAAPLFDSSLYELLAMELSPAAIDQTPRMAPPARFGPEPMPFGPYAPIYGQPYYPQQFTAVYQGPPMQARRSPAMGGARKFAEPPPAFVPSPRPPVTAVEREPPKTSIVRQRESAQMDTRTAPRTRAASKRSVTFFFPELPQKITFVN
jgi:hypothetical protein